MMSLPGLDPQHPLHKVEVGETEREEEVQFTSAQFTVV